MQNTGCLWPDSRLIVVEKQKDEQRGCRLLKKLEHVVAVGEVVAAHEIEQPAFALVETVDRGRLLAKPEQARRQVARPTSRKRRTVPGIPDAGDRNASVPEHRGELNLFS